MGIARPGPSLVAMYVGLRTWATRSGHGLAGRAHEADRWIAATSLHVDVPLVSTDRIFSDVPGLDARILPAP